MKLRFTVTRRAANTRLDLQESRGRETADSSNQFGQIEWRNKEDSAPSQPLTTNILHQPTT